MRIYTKAGDLGFSTFIFPDGQPHFKLETYEREFESVTIEAAIKNPTDLFTVLLAGDVLRTHGYELVNLDIRYLLGARMDRAISSREPFTLEMVARLINGAGFTHVRILDVHSNTAIRLIRNSWNILPWSHVTMVRDTIGEHVVICPDSGAINRVQDLAPNGNMITYCSKKRDPKTGALSGFHVPDEVKGYHTLIIDDICDGGGTFVGLAKELRAKGAKSVNLFVTHGIFSKGLPLEGVDKIFSTDSYSPWATGREFKNLVLIPISMKDL